jgi:hypothetical protein
LLKEIRKSDSETQWLENIRKNSNIELYIGLSSPTEKKRP